MDPLTGAQTTVTSAGSLVDPVGIAVYQGATPVPEPSALLLFLSGLVGLRKWDLPR